LPRCQRLADLARAGSQSKPSLRSDAATSPCPCSSGDTRPAGGVRHRRTRPYPPRHPRALPDRTPRETEVLIQVARGLSNRGIASQLLPGEATIKTYVSNILMKLGRRDRVQAVVAAYEAGLVEPRHHG
jgi:DNA-binding NarL/FixJ family response regulator